MQLSDVEKTKPPYAINVIVKKSRALSLQPTEVYHKYMGRIKIRLIKLSGGILPIYGEDYDWHWNRGLTSFKNKTILDLGADYGSTAYYFLCKGANKIIAVEGDPQLASKLKLNFRNNAKVVAIEEFIDCPKKIERLIDEYQPSLVKVDIEGSEKHILELNNIEKVNEWLIEAHSSEIYQALSKVLREHEFNTYAFDYGKTLIIYASKNAIKKKTIFK